MDSFLPITDDFLSSGFHQLYSDLNDDEKYLFTDTNDHQSTTLFVNSVPVTLNQTHGNYSAFGRNETEKEIDWVNSSSIDAGAPCDIENNFILLENCTQINSNPNTNLSFCGFEQDLEWNVENLLIENSLTCEDDWSSLYHLPEKTLLCNDSCDVFLKESSENLKMNALEISATKSPSSSPAYVLSSIPTTVAECEEKTFPCTFGTCGKVYAKPAHLKAHMRRHVGDKPYVCTWPNCAWRFSRSDELARHRRSHSGIKPYQCCYCPKCFARSDHLAKHRKVHERKMAASKIKAIWTNVAPGRPGRRPNSTKKK